MEDRKSTYRTEAGLLEEVEELRRQLEEANDTIEAIRTGQVDALVLHGDNGHQLYTLKSADQTYRVFIEKMTEGAVTLNRQGLILYANSQFAQLVHMPLSQVIGVSFNEFIAPENKQQYKSLFTGCWENDCKAEVLLIAGKDRTPVQLSLTTLELEEGVSLSIILTDLTAQKAAQQQLEKNNLRLAEINQALEASNNDLQQFASVASHDLQEPIRKIHIFSNLIKDNGSNLSAQSLQYLEKIITSSSRMKTLILDVLNYSRLSANGQNAECIDLNELLAELAEDFELIIREKNATITFSNLHCIDVNRGQMRQVFQNIISNALKFSRPDKAPVIQITSKLLKERSFNSLEVI
jgi:PAS domain S-box-containing protein